MRIDLEHSEHRPRSARLVLALVRRVIGIKPGPMLALTYRPELFSAALRRYLARGVAHAGPWSKGEAELFAAFVSNLNTCRF
jgi:hypothetical protein